MDARGVIHPRVGDQEAGRWMTPGESEHVIRAMMLILIDPWRQPHLEDHEVRFLSHHLDCMARSTVAGVGDDTCVGPEDVAVRVDLLAVVHAVAFEGPTGSIDLTAGRMHPSNPAQRFLQAPGVSRPCQADQAILGRFIDDDRQGVVACSVGDVPSLEEQEWEAEHMITMEMGDQDRRHL